jgi:hypothetical protein
MKRTPKRTSEAVTASKKKPDKLKDKKQVQLLEIFKK